MKGLLLSATLILFSPTVFAEIKHLQPHERQQCSKSKEDAVNCLNKLIDLNAGNEQTYISALYDTLAIKSYTNEACKTEIKFSRSSFTPDVIDWDKVSLRELAEQKKSTYHLKEVNIHEVDSSGKIIGRKKIKTTTDELADFMIELMFELTLLCDSSNSKFNKLFLPQATN